MKKTIASLALITSLPALAEEARQLDAHEHGVGTFNIAIEGNTLAMAFEAPGADIVGFEYAAKSDADRSMIDKAVARLASPLELFVLPDAAGCSVVKALARLESEEEHEEHGEEHHDDEEAGHTEFHAEYELTCAKPDALTEITFAYFEAFPNAQEVEVQMITPSGAQAFEVTRGASILNLGG